MKLSSLVETIEQTLRSAGLDTTTGPAATVSATLRRAFDGAGLPGTNPGNTPLNTRMPGQPGRPAAPVSLPGTFTLKHCRTPAGERAYRLYVPAALPPGRVPLVMMLHGCKQSADDFATGTRMNVLAERSGFIVVYPEQTARANGSNCWNWFETSDQQRDGGEPEILAGIVREVAATQPVDPARVVVAGLSAGAAMAVILGRTYPELFAAIGVHSGLPYGAAHDVGSAFAAMHGQATQAARGNVQGIPTIVFHGDQDHTVVAVNADAVVAQALGTRPGQPAPQACLLPDERLGGRNCSRTLYLDANGRTQVEQWVVHGAGHAWSGGNPSGSFTDAEGPDASAEMLRFFLAH